MALSSSTQAYQLHINLLDPRNFSVADVDGTGMDVSSPQSDNGGVISVSDDNFDGISSVTLSGSVDRGGWECVLQIPKYPINFADFFGVELWLTSYHSNVPTSTDLIFRGYLRARNEKVVWGYTVTELTFRQGASFLQDSSFSRGIDWFSGSASHPPTNLHGIVNHILGHTNIGDRSPATLGFPNPSYDNLSLSQGTVYSMLSSAIENATIQPLIFSRRDDSLWLTAHPNIVGSDYPNRNTIFNLEPGIIMELSLDRADQKASASTTVTITKSNQTTDVATYYNSALGSRDSFTVRSDDIGVANYLAAAYSHHANRTYPNGVKIKTGILALYDIGDIVRLTADLPQEGRHLYNEPFLVTSMTLNFDLSFDNRTLTIDSVLDQVFL